MLITAVFLGHPVYQQHTNISPFEKKGNDLF